MSRARQQWEAFWRAIPRRAPLVLLLLALPTAAALAALVEPATGRLRLRVDASADRLLPVDAPARQLYDRVQTLFGSDRALVVVLAVPDVFSREGLEAVARVSARLEALPEVEQVLSLATASHVHSVDDDIVVEPFLEELPANAAGFAALRSAVLGNPLYAGSLVSRDARSAAFVARLGKLSDEEILRRGTDRAVEAAAREALGDLGGCEIFVTGGPHIQAESARILLGESLTLPGLTLLVLAGVLVLSFPTLRGVAVPLVTIALGVLWTLGLAVAVGHALNAVTVLVPPLLVTLGLSYAVHVVSEYYEGFREHPGGDPREILGGVLAGAALPLAICGLTTAIGFGTLMLSPLGAVQDFGWLALAGTFFTLVAAVSFAPAALALFPPPRRMPPASGGRLSGVIDGFFARHARFVVDHRRGVFAVALAVFALSLVGVTQMRIGSQQIDKFRADAPVRVHFEAVNERFGGVNPITVIVETDETDAFKDPERLRAVKAFQGWVEAQPEVSDATSLVDIVEVANRAFHGDDPAALAIPDSRRLVSQLLFAGTGGELDGFVDARFQTLAVHLRTSAIDSAEVAALAARIEARLAELPTPLRGEVTGTSVVFNAALDEIIRGQASSLVTAFLIIYAILAVVFVSARIGLVALIPNVLPIAFYFGLLGFTGVLLSPGTSLVAPIVLGIAVDATIHYFARFIDDARETGSEHRATESAMRAVGRPVTYTAVALCAGFLVWNLSAFRTQGELGTLAAATIAFGWLSDMTLTPALCARLRIVTLWELLALDLGAGPERSIRLFRGLTGAQARIVALMGRLVPVRAGERLWSAGDAADALYVVIDGQLRASLGGPEGVRELAVHARGDLVGEVGLVQQARSADIDVVEEGRLLRLGREHFDQLRRRYPRIAAAVLGNLSEVLAERLVRRTREAARLG